MATIFNLTTTDDTKWIAYGPCRVLAVYGSNGASEDLYVQFHEKSTGASDPLTASAVPVGKGLYFPQGTSATYGEETFGELQLAELTVAVSKVLGSYTAATGDALNLTVVVDTLYPVTSSTTLVGDVSISGVSYKQIWTHATGSAGALRLKQLRILNDFGATIYPVIQPCGGEPCRFVGFPASVMLPSITHGQTVTFSFGRNGLYLEHAQTEAATTISPSSSTYQAPGIVGYTIPGFGATRTRNYRGIGATASWTKAGSATKITGTNFTGTSASDLLLASGEIVAQEVGAFGASILYERGTLSDPVGGTLTLPAIYRGLMVGLATGITTENGVAVYSFVSDNTCGIRAVYE